MSINPFSIQLQNLRRSRGRRQKILASQLGIDPSNLCAIENGHRPPPRDGHKFYANLRAALDLSDTEIDDLRTLAEATRKLGPAVQGTSPDQIKFGLEISRRLQSLQPAQIRALRAVLDMGDTLSGTKHGRALGTVAEDTFKGKDKPMNRP